jgi:hypothetical protein
VLRIKLEELNLSADRQVFITPSELAILGGKLEELNLSADRQVFITPSELAILGVIGSHLLNVRDKFYFKERFLIRT